MTNEGEVYFILMADQFISTTKQTRNLSACTEGTG
jgi:hypothetical protein